MFKNLLSKNYRWKNTLSLCKVIIYYEKVHLKFEGDIIFRFLKITLKIGLWYIPPYHTTCKLLERWAAWRVNTDERISKQSFQAESTYIFLRIFFSRKITVYYKILSEATTKNFRKFLGNVTSWRSAMILKKRPRLRAFF